MPSLNNPDDRTALLARLARIHPGSPRQWGKMDAREMIVHLSDSFRTSLGQRQASPHGGLLYRTLVKWIALRVPATWPQNVPTRPENDPQAAGSRPGDFAADMADLRGLIDRFIANNGGPWAPHPVFGRMTDDEWYRWGYLHMDHHLRQFKA